SGTLYQNIESTFCLYTACHSVLNTDTSLRTDTVISSLFNLVRCCTSTTLSDQFRMTNSVFRMTNPFAVVSSLSCLRCRVFAVKLNSFQLLLVPESSSG